MTDPPPDRAHAQITRLVEPGQRGTVLSGRGNAVGLVVALIPLYVFFGAMALSAVTAMYAEPVVGPVVFPVTAGGLLVSIALMIVYLACYGDYLPSRHYYRRSVRATLARPDAVVDPNDPEANYIQVIPRKNWGRQMIENASEVGFLRVDAEAGVLLYEGDAERWVIPAAAIESLAVEEFKVPPFNFFGLDVYPVLVLKVRVGGEPWEAPICPRHITFHRLVLRDRRREVYELRREIERLTDVL